MNGPLTVGEEASRQWTWTHSDWIGERFLQESCASANQLSHGGPDTFKEWKLDSGHSCIALKKEM